MIVETRESNKILDVLAVLNMDKSFITKSISWSIIYINTLFGCVFVCLYPINVKTVELIGQNFVWDLTWCYGWSKFPKISLQQNSIYIKFWKSTKCFSLNLRTFFVFVLQCIQREAPLKPSNNIKFHTVIKKIYHGNSGLFKVIYGLYRLFRIYRILGSYRASLSSI